MSITSSHAVLAWRRQKNPGAAPLGGLPGQGFQWQCPRERRCSLQRPATHPPGPVQVAQLVPVANPVRAKMAKGSKNGIGKGVSAL